MLAPQNPVAALLAASPVVLAPMEDVTDAAYRRICRGLGAVLCVTEFIGVEQVLSGSRLAQRRAALAPGDQPTAIQIYGGDPEKLLAAARRVAEAGPAYVDLNCGCWVPGVVGQNAGAAWLRDPAAMVAMVRRITAEVASPVTVKTRIGWGPESHMPVVDLARRLEDAGAAALAIHCRTAAMGHAGPADWRWAQRAQAAVAIPVIVNGDVRSADDAVRALRETGCAGVMIGRAAIANPWIFRETTALLGDEVRAPPAHPERRAVYLAIVEGSVAARGERAGVASAKRHLGVLGPLAPAQRRAVLGARTLGEARAAIDALERLAEADELAELPR